MAKSRPKETKLQKKVMDYITSNFPGSIAYKIEASVNGVPDIFASIPGFGAICIEMKRDPTEKPRANQLAMIAALNKAGTPAYVVDCWSSWMELCAVIKKSILE
jgi:hypothetical protein